jgi:DNA-binding IclR family transcriptional regulator
MEPIKKDPGIIQSLDKGLQLLEIIENETYPVTLHTLWLKLGWDKATIFRMCSTLEKRGYIRKDPASKEYSLGLKIFGLYESIMNNMDVQKISKQFLVNLARKTGESAHLGLVFEKSIVFIDKVVGKTSPPVNVQIGGREPMHCTALGKAFLSALHLEETEELLQLPFEKHTPNSLISIEALVAELETVAERGYAIDNEEYIEGVRCVAAPIISRSGNPAAAIGISAPVSRFPEYKTSSYGQLVQETAGEISRILGHNGSSRD